MADLRITSEAPTTLVIEPVKGWLGVNFREIWQHRNVLWILIWRDLKVRYKQTVLGFLWAFLQPFTKMIIFSMIFGRWAGMGPEGYPYPVFVFAGLLPWGFFSASLTRCSQSIVSQQQFITKVYFPRLILPLSAIGSALMDFAVSFLILIGLLVYYPEVQVSASIFMVVPLVLLTILISFGAGTLFAALNVAYRDVRHVVPFVVQIWMFLTPVIYPVALAPARWRWVLALNPMTGVIAGFRWAILGQRCDWTNLGISLGVGALLVVAGAAYFRRTERVFADIV